MKLHFICGCKLENYDLEDWLAHWKHGEVREQSFLGKWPKLRAVWLFLNTKIQISNDF